MHTTCWGRVYVPRTRTYNTASNRLQGLRQMEMVNVPDSDCGLRSTPVCPYSTYPSSERHGANDSPTSGISRPHQVPEVPVVAEIGAEIKGANRKIRRSIPCNPQYRSPTERLRLLASPPLNYHQDVVLNTTPCLILMHSGLSIDRSVASASRWKRRRKRVWATSVTRAANPFAGSCRFD